MLSSADEIQLIQNLVRCIGAKKTLDIGVFTGYSAMSVAMALPNDGKVIACDVSDKFPSMGKPFWEEAGVADRIELAVAPAAETLQKLLDRGEAGTFDFAFVDADKTGYDAYYELCLKLLRPNGIIAFDNMLFAGQVCNPEDTDEYTESLRKLAKKIYVDNRVYVSFLTVGDGTLLAFKK
jgi:caffeoyl-CoA O-methyltransferase